MKASNQFKETIKAHLDKLATEDPLFAPKYANEKKNIDDCCTYIMNAVQKSGCNGFADDEIYGMAVHYYDEENIDVGAPITSGSVVVNHVVELTEEEKREAREEAIRKVQEDTINEMRKKPTAKKEPAANVQQSSLFD